MVTLLSCLDLSAAFDTIDHYTLLSRPHGTFGIFDTALSLFHSNLCERTQVVSLNGISSAPSRLWNLVYLKVLFYVLCSLSSTLNPSLLYCTPSLALTIVSLMTTSFAKQDTSHSCMLLFDQSTQLCMYWLKTDSGWQTSYSWTKTNQKWSLLQCHDRYSSKQWFTAFLNSVTLMVLTSHYLKLKVSILTKRFHSNNKHQTSVGLIGCIHLSRTSQNHCSINHYTSLKMPPKPWFLLSYSRPDYCNAL